MVALPLVLFLYLRRLALRLPAPMLARHCLNVGLGFTGSMLLSIGLDWAGRNHWFRSGSVQEAWLLALALMFVFYAWSIVWLLGFAFAFRRAWRESRETWHPIPAGGLREP